MKKRNRADELTAMNEAFITDMQARNEMKGELWMLLRLLGAIADMAIVEGNCWASFGLDRNRTTLMMTVHIGNDVEYVAGLNLVDLAADCERILDDDVEPSKPRK